MKKNILIFISLFLTLTLYSQNRIGFTFAFDKLGSGIILTQDKIFNSELSLVGSFEYGSYKTKIEGVYTNFYDQIKVNKYGLGLNYKAITAIYQYNHMYGRKNWTKDNLGNYEPINIFNLDHVSKHSLELGVITPTWGKWNCIILFDVVNWGGRVGFAYTIYRRCPYTKNKPYYSLY